MPDKYILGGGFASGAGLNLQYSLVQRLLKGEVFERSIPYVQPNLKIADIPCGTCLWLIDAAEKADPSTKLDGFDINLKQGPPRVWLPPAIEIARLDLLETPPSNLLGKYDIIHVSLVVCFIDDEQIETLIGNVLSLLKPGGYIQWMEWSIGDTRFESPDPNYTPSALPEAVCKLWKTIGWKSPSWPNNLRNLLLSGGLESATTRSPKAEPYIARAFADGELMGMRTTFEAATERKPSLKNDWKDFDKMLLEAEIEVQEKGVGCFPDLTIVTGRKPPQK